jgi:anti-sigma regulatory factor (Ser/Thr protein kinase)
MRKEAQHADVRERFYRRERRSVPAAREFAREVLAVWEFGSRADEVLLCVSELTTNALLHGVPPGRGFLLQLSRDAGGVLRVEVHDSGGGWPRSPAAAAEGADGADGAGAGGGQAAAEERESGRGLFLVDALSDKWDVGGRSPGKIVWCEFAPR